VLPKNLRQEALSIAYIRAIAARCGLLCQPSEADFGVDLTLLDLEKRPGRIGLSGYQLAIQDLLTLTALNALMDKVRKKEPL
jgi:hypothetical protein